MKNETPSPDMSAENAAELKRLRKEAERLIKADARAEKKVIADLNRIERQRTAAVKRLEAACAREVKAANKEAATLSRPLDREFNRRFGADGRGQNPRLRAIEHRIAVLTGRLTS